MNYITGYSTGKSYLIGHGPNQPQRPHHRGAACKKITKVTGGPALLGGQRGGGRGG
jgi:hypothetical protein